MLKFFIAIFISIIVLAIVGCQSTPEVTIKRYSLINEIDSYIEVPIFLQHFGSFNELSKRIETIVCNDSIPIITIQNGGSEIKQIQLLNPCWETTACMLIKKRNVLKIKDDAIHVNRVIPLDSLEITMMKHYNNNRKSPFYSEHPQKALISIDYEEKGMDNLPNLLNRITDCFDKIQNNNILVIKFEEDIPLPSIIE